MQEIWDAKIAPNVWNQYHNQLEIYLSFAHGDHGLDILDVGCAQGTLALMLAESGHKVCAIDLRPEFLEYALTRYEIGDIEFVEGNILDMRITRSFDLIYANQIIEHLVYPLELLNKLKSLLKPNGKLIVATPNGDYIRNKLPSFTELGDPSDYEEKQFTSDGDGHFFLYRINELVQILKKSGFESIETTYFESPWISGHMKVRYFHKWIASKWLKGLDTVTLTFPVIKTLFAHQLLVTATFSK